MGKKLKKTSKRSDGVARSTQQGMPFHTNKGQHILVNPGILNAIVEKAAIQSSDAVMEVGSGTGNLTVRLLDRAKVVYACELDPRMIAELQKRVVGTANASKLHVVPGDVLKTMDKLKFDVCVANLPYNISSPFVNAILTHRPVIKCAIVMFQKEFADRLTAQPGHKHYSRLSLNVQLLAKVEHLINVKRGEFRPPPQVDSAVVRIEPRWPPPPISFSEWDGVTRIVFHRKNRTVHASMQRKTSRNELFAVYSRRQQEYVDGKLKSEQPIPKLTSEEFREKLETVIEKSGFAKKRPRRMDVDDFLRLMLAFNREGIHFA